MAASQIRIALVGIGKIARDQHIPALRANMAFDLVAAVSRSGGIDGLPCFESIQSLLASGIAVDAVSLATPPQGRHALAKAALDARLHVTLEKPPAATVSEAVDLIERARASGRTLFASWHSREASAVDAARDWLAGRRIRSGRIAWKEDIRVWHPGQEWILDAGGLGVFDPGINALSILTAILPGRVLLRAAELRTPANRASPIAASLTLDHEGAPIEAEFDFLQAGPQSWDISIAADYGCLTLSEGGARLSIDGIEQPSSANDEYPRLYRRFAKLVASGQSDADLAPMQLVADAFLVGSRHEVATFAF